MGCVQSYFKRAHNAGLSPSSTQDSNSKPPVSDEDAKPISEEKSVTEEPESNDTSYGVEATAVRTLAATTGTVAILGTTAKTNDKKVNEGDEDSEGPNTTTPPVASDVIPEGNEKEEEDTVAVVHDTTSKTINEVSRNESEEVKKTTSPLDTRPTSAVKMEHILLEEVKDNTQSTTNKTDVVDNKPSPVDDLLKRTSAEHAENVPSTVESEKSKSEEDSSVTNEENAKAENNATPEKTEVDSGGDVTSEVSNTETKPKEDEVTKNEETENDKGSETNKGNEEENSKSISSERLKTNSISDTTLSESYNAELENNSIKQSSSVDKAAESFDSSSTIEFVDLENKESARQKRDVNDLFEAKEPNALSENTDQTEVNQTGIVNVESEPQSNMLPNVSGEADITDKSENKTEITEDQLLEARPSERAVEIVGTELSSVLNNTSREEQNVTPFTDDRSESVVRSYESKQAESGPKADEAASHIDHSVLLESEKFTVEEQNKSEVTVIKTDTDGEVVHETVNAAATAIQATFRGFQTRKQLKEEKENEVKVEAEEIVNETESNDANIVVTEEKQVTEGETYDESTPKEKLEENVDKPEDSNINSAATTIQATFRGFQTRKQLKEEIKDESIPDSEDKENVIEEKVVEPQVNEKLNVNVTETSSDKSDSAQPTQQAINDKADDEIQESSVTAEGDKINSAATTIQATFRGFQARKQLKDEIMEEVEGDEEKENITEATSDNMGLVLESAQITEVQKEVQSNINKEEKTTNEAEDDKTNAAATAIQATFRGFQTRKQLKHETENETVTTEEENVNITEATKEEDTVNIIDDVDYKMNSAATAIQATFRGFQSRKQLKDEKEEVEDNLEGVDNVTETAGVKTISAAIVEEETKVKADAELNATEEKEVNTVADDVVNSAAATIQATFRGYQTRKQLKEDEHQTKAEEKENVSEAVDTETDGIKEASEPKVADDSQLTEEQNESEKMNSAASTIQATFRGFQTRKQLKDQNEDEPLSVAESKENANEPTEQTKEENETKDVAISEESKETLIQAVDDIIDSAATTIQTAFRGFQARQLLKNEETKEALSCDLPVGSEVPTEPVLSSDADNASQIPEDLAAMKIQATFRGFQVRQQLKNEKDENTDNKLEHSPMEHSPSEISKTSEDESEQLKRQSEGDKDSLSEEIRQSLSKLEDTIQREENKLNMASERLPEQIGESSDEGYEQPDASGDGSFDRGTRTPTALTPEQIDVVKEEVDEICKQAVATTESILAVKSGLGDSHADDAESKEETEDKGTHTETPSDNKNDNKDVAVASSWDTTQNVWGRPETLVVIEDADEKLVSAATTIQATFRGYQTRQKLAETEQPDSLPDFPPPALDDEYLFGPSVADEDLPPPDFEALESSYSEDAPTEPLAPPPPLDQDTEKFIEEEDEDIDEEELKSLQRPPECDELPENRLTTDKSTSGETGSTVDTNTSTDAESSLSSAATKIQAGVRGYLTRKQLHGDTTSTSGPSIVDSDQSLGNMSTSREEEGPVRSNISMEEESEICRHTISPEISDELKQTNSDQPRRPTHKRMSLGSNIIDKPTPKRKPLRTLSVQAGVSEVTDEEVWDVLKSEMSEAATVIQSNYRGYRARKQLQREDAVQVLTSSSSVATNGVSSLDRDMEVPTRNSGELHDIIALTPPNIEQTSSVAAEGGTGDLTAFTAPAQISTPTSDEMVKRRAEPDQDHQQTAAKRTHTSLTRTTDDQVLKDANIAAAKIQAGFRGYKVRKQLRNRDSSGSVNGPKRSGTNHRLEGRGSRSSTMSLEDESAAKIQAGVRGFLVRRRRQVEKEAATKIQAGFRGFKARRQVNAMKTDK